MPISNLAWSHLRERAEFYGYVKHDSISARGIVNYFAMLSHQQFEDRRSQRLLDISTKLLDHTYDRTRRALGAVVTREDRSPLQLWNEDEYPPANPKHTPPGTRYGLWWNTDDESQKRRPRTVVKHLFPLDFFARLALINGITDPYYREFQMSLTSRAANALEAIGRQTLQPLQEWPNPNPYKRQQVRRTSNWEIVF